MQVSMTSSQRSLAERVLASGPAVAALSLLQRASVERCTVLLYHSVTQPGPYPGLDADSYRAQMALLAEEFHVVSADQYLRHLGGETKLPPRSVLVTFDDGFVNNLEVVQPIMKHFGLPWVLFTTTCAIRGGAPWLWGTRLKACCLFAQTDLVDLLGKRWSLGSSFRERLAVYKQMNRVIAGLPMAEALPPAEAWIERHWHEVPADYVDRHCRLLNAAQLQELADSPLVEIGCHTRTHPFLNRIPDAALVDEIDGAMNDLEEITGRRPRMFAYPSGAFGQREARRAAAAGATCAFAVADVVDARSPYEITRFGVYSPGTTVLRAKGLGLGRHLRRLGVPVG
jgi:peptidoglycan/xylan/chitin deacetylase (PgdA/CDA1 family)